MSLALLRPAFENPPQVEGVWSAAQLAAHPGQVVGSGYPALDVQLPGGGWPLGGLTELLQTQPGTGEWGLVLPALAATVVPRCVVLVGAPHMPLAASLHARGLEPQRLLWVHNEAPAARAWACEQALRCADVAAVLAWLPQAHADVLRRLHLAAQEHAKLLWVVRPVSAQHEASPAPLRLLLQGTARPDTDTDDAPTSLVRILKRRGPPLEAAIALPLQSAALRQLLAITRLRARRRNPLQHPAQGSGASLSETTMPPCEAGHALDRLASPV